MTPRLGHGDAGNILSRKEYAFTTGTLGAVLDTVSYGYTDSAWGDLLTSYDGKAIITDEIGNMLTDGTWTYTWEHGRELASMSDGATTWSMTYNADGLRTKRTNGTKTYNYTYYGGQLVCMSVDDTELAFYISPDGTPMAVTYQGTVYLYVTNLQGDVVAILDTSGNEVVKYTYDAWGNVLTTTGSMASTLGTHNPIRYRGYYYDRETDFYYLQSRYYDPSIGRFLNADAFTSTGQGLLGNNMFAYCINNPVIYIDISGTASAKIDLTDQDKDGDGVADEPAGPSGGGGRPSGGTANKTHNPWGRPGSPKHQNAINKIKQFLEGKGYSVTKEYYIQTPGGAKTARYADIYATGNGSAFVVQVGKLTSSGYPVSRERVALLDILNAGYYVCFVEY